MTPEQFRVLVQAYKDNRLTEAEWLALRETLAEGTYDHLLEEDIRRTFDQAEPLPEWDTLREEKIWRILQPEETPAQEERHTGKSTTRWLRWVAAAAALPLLAGGLYLFREKEKPQTPPAAVSSPVPPGSNKASLLLANGQRVILDSIGNSTIPSQGGTEVRRLDSGMLTYTAGTSAAGVVYNTISTPRGGQYQLLLADGTKVWLNASSSLRFPTAFPGNERRVELSGEAYFEVKHNSAQPFRVTAGGHVIEDIGTSFNINTYDDEIVARTTLIEGSARVTDIHQRNVTLLPGQQAHWQAAGKIGVASDVDIEDAIAWKNGQISFANVDFASLMRRIARWYDVDIHYTGAVPKTRFFGILNRNVYLTSILEYLQKNGAHIRQEGKNIIVLP